MTSDDYIKSKLADLCWQEGHEYGGINNMLAIGFMMRNRVHAGWLGGDWLACIAEYYINAEGEKRPSSTPNLRDPMFRELLAKIDGVYEASAADKMTQGALYCADLNKISRQWFVDNIVRKPEEHKRIAQVGPVYFFT